MRVAIIGCGAVAEVHAAGLRNAGIPIAVVCDSCIEQAQSFAAVYGVERVALDLPSAVEAADAVIIASPSPLHYQHAMAALESGVHVLVELPPCHSTEQADRLEQVAARANLVVQCAHTSRYLEPYQKVSEWIRRERFGEVRQIHYFRCVTPARRSWTDDALRHHAAHPVDLFLHWFDGLQPVGCAAFPCDGAHSDVSLLARLQNGAPASISISYSANRAHSRLSVIGDQCTMVTDGFTFIDSSDAAMNWHGDATAVYKQAVEAQDREFLRCCETGEGGVPWNETVRMMRQLQGASQ